MNSNLCSRLLRYFPLVIGTLVLVSSTAATAQCTTTSPNAYWESFGTGCGTPPVLTASAAPVLGTTIGLITSVQPATTVFTMTVLSLARSVPLSGNPAGLPPGCLAFIGGGPGNIDFPVAGTTVSALAIPNAPGLTGLVVYGQSAALLSVAPWAELTNAVCLHIGT